LVEYVRTRHLRSPKEIESTVIETVVEVIVEAIFMDENDEDFGDLDAVVEELVSQQMITAFLRQLFFPSLVLR